MLCRKTQYLQNQKPSRVPENHCMFEIFSKASMGLKATNLIEGFTTFNTFTRKFKF